jgi:RNA polymerase sigma-70 factor, ECF subfamily
VDFIVINNRNISQDMDNHVNIEGLVSRAQNGDKDAFSVLYQEYVQPVYRYIYVRVGNNTEQTEDLTQEVFFKALKNINRYRYNGNTFGSWLFRIAHNIVIDYYRQSKKNKSIPLNESITIIADDDPETMVEQHMEMVEVKTMVEKLPAKQREVISLRFGSGLSVAETAAAIGKTEGTVKKLQFVALARLKKLMKI